MSDEALGLLAVVIFAGAVLIATFALWARFPAVLALLTQVPQ